ncbi:MAG TPA: hypothetical protein VLQ46_10490 [Casimicrobiaceae bacterium]|nr:hypothetical protein [Casimicrobiaceae bacterium]
MSKRVMTTLEQAGARLEGIRADTEGAVSLSAGRSQMASIPRKIPRRTHPTGEGADTPPTMSDLPCCVTVPSKGRAPRTIWRCFVSRAGALAEVRLLHARCVEHARVEGP